MAYQDLDRHVCEKGGKIYFPDSGNKHGPELYLDYGKEGRSALRYLVRFLLAEDHSLNLARGRHRQLPDEFDLARVLMSP